MTTLDLRTLRLAPGDYRREQVTATIAPFTAGAQEYHAEPADVQAELGLTRLAGGLLFDLAFDVSIVGPCQRCLEPAHAELVGDGARVPGRHPRGRGRGDDAVPRGRVARRRPLGHRRAILALPIVIRCREDCAGLCPQCGADRNLVACGCEPPKDARWERLRELL